jgi:hypothetical protein
MNLFARIRTTDERDRLDHELDQLLTSLYENKVPAENSNITSEGIPSDIPPELSNGKLKSMGVALRTQVRSWVAEIILEELPDSIDAAEEYLKSLKDKLAKLKKLKLVVAFEPTDSSIDKFIGFVHKNISQDVILEFEIDPQIYGGAQITYQGEYRDLSLKRLYESEYKEKEVELKKVIASKHG